MYKDYIVYRQPVTFNLFFYTHWLRTERLVSENNCFWKWGAKPSKTSWANVAQCLTLANAYPYLKVRRTIVQWCKMLLKHSFLVTNQLACSDVSSLCASCLLNKKLICMSLWGQTSCAYKLCHVKTIIRNWCLTHMRKLSQGFSYVLIWEDTVTEAHTW